MDSQNVSGHEYRDFEPTTNIVQEVDYDTIVFFLPGFREDQLRFQLTPDRKLKISGERQTGDNKWIRFQKTLSVSENCDATKITTKFELKDNVGILSLRQPKLITPTVNRDGAKSPQNETQPPVPRTTEMKKGFNQINETKGVEEMEDSKYDTAEDHDVAQKSQKEEEKERNGGVENDKNGCKKRLYKLEYGEFMRGRVIMGKKVARIMIAFMVVLSAIVLGIYVKNLFAPVENNYDN